MLQESKGVLELRKKPHGHPISNRLEQDRSKPVNDETYQGGFVIVWTVYDRNKCFPCYNFVHK